MIKERLSKSYYLSYKLLNMFQFFWSCCNETHIKLDCVYVRVNTVEFSVPSGYIRRATTIESSNGETASTSNGHPTHLNTELRPHDSRCSSSNECASGHHDTTEDRMLSGTFSLITARHGSDDFVCQPRLVNGTPRFLDSQRSKTPESIDVKLDRGPHPTPKHWYFYP